MNGGNKEVGGIEKPSVVSVMTKIGSKNFVESLYLEADLGCSTIDNHDGGVNFGNVRERNGRNCDGGNSAYKVFDRNSPYPIYQNTMFGSKKLYGCVCSLFNCVMGWNELCAVSMFIWGLQPEIGTQVRLFKPNTLYNAYLLANMQEATNKLLGQSCRKNVDSNFVVLDVVGCLRRDGNEIVIDKQENEVKQDSSVSNVRVAANDFDDSVATDSDIRKQNVDFRKDIKGDEVIEFVVDDKDGGYSVEDICEQNVEGADMELDDNNCLVVIDKVCNKAGKGNDLESNESSEVEVNWVVIVDEPVKVEDKNKSEMIVDKFVLNDENSEEIEDIWKWPKTLKAGSTCCKRKDRGWNKIVKTQCKVKCRRKSEMWKWPNRKKRRRKESWVKLVFCWNKDLYIRFVQWLDYLRQVTDVESRMAAYGPKKAESIRKVGCVEHKLYQMMLKDCDFERDCRSSFVEAPKLDVNVKSSLSIARICLNYCFTPFVYWLLWKYAGWYQEMFSFKVNDKVGLELILQHAENLLVRVKREPSVAARGKDTRNLKYLFMPFKDSKKNGVGLCYWKFNIWKWRNRKNMGVIYCQVKTKEWKFDIWRWPKRKKKRVTFGWLSKNNDILATYSTTSSSLKRLIQQISWMQWDATNINTEDLVRWDATNAEDLVQWQDWIRRFLHLIWFSGTLMFFVDKKLKGDGMIRVQVTLPAKLHSSIVIGWLDQLVTLLDGNPFIVRLGETVTRFVRSFWLLVWKKRLQFIKCTMLQTLKLSHNLKSSLEPELFQTLNSSLELELFQTLKCSLNLKKKELQSDTGSNSLRHSKSRENHMGVVCKLDSRFPEIDYILEDKNAKGDGSVQTRDCNRTDMGLYDSHISVMCSNISHA
ncbi:hypothetical protein Tco_1501519 [Tanacetum coccineum]